MADHNAVDEQAQQDKRIRTTMDKIDKKLLL